MKFENTQVWGFQHALRGMRNPKESWHLSDSEFGIINSEVNIDGAVYFDEEYGHKHYAKIGPNDMRLAQGLIKAGNEHRKFMRQIFVSVDITASLYWY